VAEPKTPTQRGTRAKVITSIAVCALLIGAAAGVNFLILASEPTAKQEGATRKTAALVETITTERGTYTPKLEVLGLVEPAREIMLSPRVSGQIIDLDPAFVPGGLVQRDDVLLRIDPADFERELAIRQSELKQVEASLAIEQGRQNVAREEFELLGEDIDPSNRSLVLREPQIESMRAQVEAAKAAVAQAELDLDRATVRAPFDAQILTRSTNIGSQVSPSDELAHLVGVDEYWVMASVPLRNLRWLTFTDTEEQGSPVEVRHTGAWDSDTHRQGSVARLIGSVDQQTRLARVLITVPDPLARQTDGPPLILGTIVELQIAGREIPDVVRLDRAYLRQNDTVWLMVDDKLEIRETQVVFRDATHAYIRSGLEAGEEVVTTSLATVTNGLDLRRIDQAETTPEPGS